MTKLCNSCGTVKPLEEFTKAGSKNRYKVSGDGLHSYCKVCNAERAREWRKNNPNYKGTGRVNSIPENDRLLMSAIRQRITDARSRCKKLNRNAPVLTDSYLYELFIKQDRSCALTGAKLLTEPNHPLCLSLDQIEPEKGYVEGNVQWLAWCVNRAKGDLSLDDFHDMCESVLSYRKVQRLSKGDQ